MSEKILIKANKESNLLDALVYFMETEKMDYIVSNSLEEDDIANIIYIDDECEEINSNVPIIFISGKKRIVKTNDQVINYIVTNLINESVDYTEIQKEYLFKKGIYNIFLHNVSDLLKNDYNYNGMIIDLTEIKTAPYNWVFNFDSIAETYAWLSKMNRMQSDSFVRKSVNFYDAKVYNDSIKEINYLTDKIIDIKDKKKSIDIFILNPEELAKLKENYFFKVLLQNISDTYQIYLVDKDKFAKEEPSIYEAFLDGMTIYEDCIYRDTYKDEISLGFVDCTRETYDKYCELFDYTIRKYGVLMSKDGE
ncbi:MAG: hypothetical protein OSJ70_06270 [Bacilli bacterium]|nr:hypothetical protein [Bacilli bacterium]